MPEALVSKCCCNCTKRNKELTVWCFFSLAKLDYSITGFCLHWYHRVESGDKGGLVYVSEMKEKGKEPEKEVEFLGKFSNF